jgi:hypothetical protein
MMNGYVGRNASTACRERMQSLACKFSWRSFLLSASQTAWLRVRVRHTSQTLKSLEPSRETLIDMHEEAMGFSILANALFLASRGGRKLSIPDSFRDKVNFSAEREPLPFVGAMLLKDLVHFVEKGRVAVWTGQFLDGRIEG